MKKFITAFLVIMTLFGASSYAVAYAETNTEERDSEKHDESAYELMSYSDDSWYEFGEGTVNSIASTIKGFMWMINLVLSKVVLMFVFQMFSLDIVEITIDAVRGITSAVANGLLSTFGTFALAIFSIGILIKAYIQQSWQAFIKLTSLVVISLSLLFSISSERFDYISLANGLSIEVENMVMNVNPSLTGDDDFDADNMNSTAVALENKVFDALIYKPYLLLQYGTTDESAILEEDEQRISAYLEANPQTEDGIAERQDIAANEYKVYNNLNIFAGNGFKQSGYILVMLLSTIIQGVVFFFIALLRIMLQFGFVVMLLLAPFAIFMSIFPSFETVVGKYARALGLLILFKGVVMFFALVAVSFISLGYDMTNSTDDLYYRIFIQIIMSVATIFLYTKRQAVMNIIEGASLSVDDMGGGHLPRMNRNPKLSSSNKRMNQLNKGRALRDKMKKGAGASISVMKKAGTNLSEKSKNVGSTAGSNLRNINEGAKTATNRFKEQQLGESSERNIYEGNSGERAAEKEVATASERQPSNSKISQARSAVVTQLRGESPSGGNHASANNEQTANSHKTNAVHSSPKRKASSVNAINQKGNSKSANKKSSEKAVNSSSRKVENKPSNPSNKKPNNSGGKINERNQSVNSSRSQQNYQPPKQSKTEQAERNNQESSRRVAPKENQESGGRFNQSSRLNQRAE
ncbi:CD3337/EF1877 family mobilome membrane protein [Cytobacillus kochii]